MIKYQMIVRSYGMVLINGFPRWKDIKNYIACDMPKDYIV